MPSKSPDPTEPVLKELSELGQYLRVQRKAMKLSAAVVSEAAGISRVTLYRIEKGEPSVTIGAYLLVLDALGLKLKPQLKNIYSAEARDVAKWLPLEIYLDEYPQLRQLAWHVSGTNQLTPREAFDIYERNERYLNPEKLNQKEADLIESLRKTFLS